jgi:hypothetical protein
MTITGGVMVAVRVIVVGRVIITSRVIVTILSFTSALVVEILTIILLTGVIIILMVLPIVISSSMVMMGVVERAAATGLNMDIPRCRKDLWRSTTYKRDGAQKQRPKYKSSQDTTHKKLLLI